MNNYALFQCLAPLQSAQKSRSGRTHTETEYVTWNKTKQARTILSAQTVTSSGLSVLSLTSGFDLSLFFFSDASMACMTTIESTCGSVRSCVNSGELNFFIFKLLVLCSRKGPERYLLSVLRLYVWKELLNATETEHSCLPAHCYGTDGTIQFSA